VGGIRQAGRGGQGKSLAPARTFMEALRWVREIDDVSADVATQPLTRVSAF
jgi:hypothetical protein